VRGPGRGKYHDVVASLASLGLRKDVPPGHVPEQPTVGAGAVAVGVAHVQRAALLREEL
jgi:hypothetical protein